MLMLFVWSLPVILLYLSDCIIRHSNGLGSRLTSTLSDLRQSSNNSKTPGVCILFVTFTQFCLSISLCEFIYLVSKQSSFFGFSSSSNQYWSYESRSSWLLWLLCLLFSLLLRLYQSLSLLFTLFLSHLYPPSIFVFFLSIPVSFSSSVLTFCLLPPTPPPPEKLLCPSGRSPARPLHY